ncbi:lytic polysaccharide monooxygenase [Actinoplanes sp. NPDC051851]|uniref:lytic polysaccharide monooxygenase auxiliary activity family 9 protein n=1 Tax=Actinoplanes sp. NPDC051851 TaxID=3154753 RepID=UPI003448CA61
MRKILISALVAAVAATITVLAVSGGPAAAHGNVLSPASRNYGCFERWGDDFQAPEMATEDPMCYQAWQADPQAMWNWNGLYREGVAGDHQGAIPDGQLCSAGLTQNGRYAAMDTIGDWKAADVANSFTLQLFDGARHGADYIWVYVTKPGYDPITEPLAWSDLDLVSQVGDTPADQWTEQLSNGVQMDIPVSVSGRTGRAMVYTIWQASHLDQSYYFCSDVNFGGTTTPTSSPTSSPTTSPTTTTPTTSPTTTPPSTGSGCSAAVAVASQWSGAYQATVTVTAGSAAIKAWAVTLTYGAAQTVQQSWNATVLTSGNDIQATNASYNGALSAGGSTTFGFIAAGTPAAPTVNCASA